MNPAQDPGIFMDVATSSTCGAVNPLVLWHAKYAIHFSRYTELGRALIRDLESDELDYATIEAEVQQLIPKADVSRGFCEKCRWLLDHWFEDNPSDGNPEDNSWAPSYRWVSCTKQMEAAAIVGCMFCALLLSKLKEECKLDTFRKIEKRLDLLGKDARATLVESGTKSTNDPLPRSFWLAYPGLRQLTSSDKSDVRIRSELVSPTCKLISCLCLLSSTLAKFT